MTNLKTDSGTTTSAWMDTANVPDYPPLEADTECEVCIVGAGLAGMSIAYTLARAGKNVIVLDDGPIGGGESGRTTAHLTWALDDFYAEIEKVHGADGARIAAERNYRQLSLAEGLAAFRTARRDNLAVLRALTTTQWYRSGTQEGVGRITLADIPRMMVEHDASHRVEIEAWLRHTATI